MAQHFSGHSFVPSAVLKKHTMHSINVDDAGMSSVSSALLEIPKNVDIMLTSRILICLTRYVVCLLCSHVLTLGSGVAEYSCFLQPTEPEVPTARLRQKKSPE